VRCVGDGFGESLGEAFTKISEDDPIVDIDAIDAIEGLMDIDILLEDITSFDAWDDIHIHGSNMSMSMGAHSFDMGDSITANSITV
jgi:hypothetical protein